MLLGLYACTVELTKPNSCDLRPETSLLGLYACTVELTKLDLKKLASLLHIYISIIIIQT